MRIVGVVFAVCLLAADAVAGDPSPRGLVVFAATSVRDPFAKLVTRFEEKHPGVKEIGRASCRERVYSGV